MQAQPEPPKQRTNQSVPQQKTDTHHRGNTGGNVKHKRTSGRDTPHDHRVACRHLMYTHQEWMKSTCLPLRYACNNTGLRVRLRLRRQRRALLHIAKQENKHLKSIAIVHLYLKKSRSRWCGNCNRFPIYAVSRFAVQPPYLLCNSCIYNNVAFHL